MKLIKKLVDWFEDLLWTRAIKAVFENSEYYFDGARMGDVQNEEED